MQLQHPLQTPAGFIENVRNAVGARPTAGLNGVVKDLRAARQAPGREHLRRGVAGGQKVFEQVARIVPAASAIEESSVGQRPVSGSSIQ